MKTLKLDHELAEAVIEGSKTSTWRLFDDKQLAVNDTIELIDKVDPNDTDSWRVIGTAVIDKVVEKRLRDLDEADWEGHERYASTEEMYDAFRLYYGPEVGPDTPVKIIHFSFKQYQKPQAPVVEKPTVKEIKLFADGGSRGNPGPSASGYVLLDMDDNVLVENGVYLGITTNNQAEYQALKFGLEQALKMGVREVAVYMDSMLVINQMKGIFKVKNRDLWPIHQSIKDTAAQFKKVSYTHVPRELNKLADAEVNKSLDAELGR